MPGQLRKSLELNSPFELLAQGELPDDASFDLIYPNWIRMLSRVHWTPLPVVRRVLQLLPSGLNVMSVLDVGSGAGKFCLAAAMISGHTRFTGLEQRAPLVRISRELIQQYRIPRVSFIHGNLDDIDWAEFDAIYLFNPFEEQISASRRIDSTVRVSNEQFSEYISTTRKKLKTLRPRARVLTYHGFGGKIPNGFNKIASEFCCRGPLECWERD